MAEEEPQVSEEQQEAERQQQAEEQQEREEEAAEKAEEEDEPRDVESSMVASWGFDREAEELEVVFVNGHTESYSCSPAMWEDAKLAPSVGQWMHANVL